MAWGHKTTISIYVNGEDHAKTVKWVMASVENMILPPETAFVGVATEPVEDEPKDQGAS